MQQHVYEVLRFVRARDVVGFVLDSHAVCCVEFEAIRQEGAAVEWGDYEVVIVDDVYCVVELVDECCELVVGHFFVEGVVVVVQ